MASPIMSARKVANWPPEPSDEALEEAIHQEWVRQERERLWKNTIAKILPTDISRPNLKCDLCWDEATRFWDDDGWKTGVYPPLCDRSADLCPDCVAAYEAVTDRASAGWKWE